mgnify:CR=1 FL=1|tara:strand:- start:2787 stop:3317 length:531 start_codon:yes stop_codon:yes gene_type:complete
MPKSQIDYSKIVIYKICCKDKEISDVYVGRTTNFQMRQSQHKIQSKNSKTNQTFVYININQMGGWGNWEMVIIEEYPCENSIEANNREQYWINKLQASLNTQIKFDNTPDTDYKKEWYFKNREKVREKQENYRQQKKKEKEDYLANFKLDLDDESNNPEWYINNVKYREKLEVLKN